MDRRFAALLGSISLKGDGSLSEDVSGVIFGGSMLEESGEPSYFFDKNPAWKRVLLGWTASMTSGGGGIGEEPGD